MFIYHRLYVILATGGLSVTHFNISYNKWRFLNVQVLRGWWSYFNLAIRILFGSSGFESYISARLGDIFQLLLVKKCSARPCRTADGINEEDSNDNDLRDNNFTFVVCVIIIIIIVTLFITFTAIYLTQIMILRLIILQLFCCYNVWCM
jgi:hypothetical protein